MVHSRAVTTPSRDRVPWGLAAALALAYATVSLLRHLQFRSSGFDLGIFDQAIWHYSRLQMASNTISGYGNILAEHFHPILMLLAPAYWLAPRPETLLVIQAVLVSLSVVPVYAFVKRRLGRPAATAWAAAYGVFWPLQRLIWFDFHEVAFAPALVAFAVDEADRRRWGRFWTAALLLLLVKEDMALVVIGLGVWLAAIGRVRHGLGAVATGLVTLVLLVGAIMPALSDTGTYAFEGPYREFGGGPLGIAGAILRNPAGVLRALVIPPVKLLTIAALFGPFLGLSLASPLSIAAVPLVIARFLSNSPNHWTTVFHYWAPIAPLLAMSAADGAMRLLRRFPSDVSRQRVQAVVCALALVACAVVPGRLPLWRLALPRTYQLSEAARVGHRLVAVIPPDASVVAQDAIVPHLSRRDAIFTLKDHAPEADLVVAAFDLSPWPNATPDEVKRLIAERQAAGYLVWRQDGSWIVLRSPHYDPERR